MMQRFLKTPFFAILMVVLVAVFVARFSSTTATADKVSYGQFNSALQAGEIKSVEMRGRNNTLRVTPRKGKDYEVGYAQSYGDDLQSLLIKARAEKKISDFDVKGTRASVWLTLLAPSYRSC